MKRNLVIILLALLIIGGGYVGWNRLMRHRHLQARIGIRQSDAAAARPMTIAEQWPKWRGPRGDGVSREPLPDSIPASGLKALWTADVGIGYSTPVALDGKLYLFSLHNSKEALTCFDAQTGQVIWSDEQGTGWDTDYPGTRGAPTIDGDAVYTYGGGGDLACRDLATGKLRWQMNVLKTTNSSNLQFGVASTPWVDAKNVYVQSGDGGAVAVAVHKVSGTTVWQSEARGKGGYSAIISADVQGTSQLVVFASDGVLGLNPDTGKTIWTQGWATSFGVNATTPVYVDGNLFVTSEYGQGCLMLKLSPNGAERVWSKKEVQSKFQQVIVDQGYLYAATHKRLKCLTWPEGAVKWKTEQGEPAVGENGSIVRSGDKLLVLSDQGMLSLVKATPDGVQLLGQFQAVEEEKIWSTPVLYGGRVYIKGPKELVCFDLGTKSARATTVPIALRQTIRRSSAGRFLHLRNDRSLPPGSAGRACAGDAEAGVRVDRAIV